MLKLKLVFVAPINQRNRGNEYTIDHWWFRTDRSTYTSVTVNNSIRITTPNIIATSSDFYIYTKDFTKVKLSNIRLLNISKNVLSLIYNITYNEPIGDMCYLRSSANKQLIINE